MEEYNGNTKLIERSKQLIRNYKKCKEVGQCSNILLYSIFSLVGNI